MSAPLAGKFEDYYMVLGVPPKADSETIQQTYLRLAKRFHPSNPETGDKEQFDAVNRAYEVLSDPMARRDFDKIKGIGEEETGPRFTGAEFFERLGRENGLRLALLSILYDRRCLKPFTPSLSMRHIENMLQSTGEELTLALWYLKQRGFAMSDDKSALLITVEGMDYLESTRPSAETVMPYIKASALA